jgi:predicted dinucleotide-binding enzyme
MAVLNRRIVMSYAIVGFGPVGQALARAFARKNIEVAVASRRPPHAQAPQVSSSLLPYNSNEGA